MKSIINGALYDTDKATEIANYWNGLPISDFRNISETLYKTKKGNLFLYGTGGPLTEYAESCGSYTCGTEIIVPMTVKDVLEWCERRQIQNDTLLDLLSGSITEA